MRHWLFLALLGLYACSDKGSGLRDGGGFVLPDGGFPDAAFPDAAPVDAGPYVCNPACTSGEVCGCVGEPTPSCGCRAAGTYAAACDPQHPETCAAPFSCQPGRVSDDTLYRCTDGREGSACSKASQVCTTALGCVCLTSPIGITDCTCLETVAADTMLCDNMVPASCPNGACLRQEGSRGEAWWFCSHGAPGDPCEVNNDICQTTLGCTCPLIAGQERCLCSEPADEGLPCDPTVLGSCVDPLMCVLERNFERGDRTICSSGGGQTDGGLNDECDPMDPGTCPPAWLCLRMAGRFRCVPP